MTRMLLTVAALLIATSAQAQVMPCASSPTPEATVACERDRMGQEAMKAPKNIVTFLRRVAAGLNEAGVDGGPFGILVKTGGHNCDGYSCDIICSGNGTVQRQWDVLVDAGGASAPVWAPLGDGIVVRPCEVVPATNEKPAPPAPTTPKPSPSVDLSSVLVRLDALAAQVSALQGKIDQAAAESLNAATRALTITELLRNMPQAGAAAPVLFPDYNGRIFGQSVTLRPVRR